MSSCRIRHESHTCSDLSYRIVMWNASDVQQCATHTPLNPDRRRNWSWEPTLRFRVLNRCQISCRSYHRHSQCKLPKPKWSLISDIGNKLDMKFTAVSDCANCARMKKEIETSVTCLLKNSEVVLGLATAHHRNLTWKLMQVRRSSVPDRYHRMS